MLDIKEENGNIVCSYTETVIKEIVKKDDEHTKKIIKDYVRKKYPHKKVRIDFLDEDIVNEIIDLGICEYQKRHRLENRYGIMDKKSR